MDGPGVYEWRSMTVMRKWVLEGGGGGGGGETGWMCNGLLEKHSMNYQDVVYNCECFGDI